MEKLPLEGLGGHHLPLSCVLFVSGLSLFLSLSLSLVGLLNEPVDSSSAKGSLWGERERERERESRGLSAETGHTEQRQSGVEERNAEHRYVDFRNR